MLILRIKHAECALAEGRLEEAYHLICHDEIRQHRRGQKLLGRLVDRFLGRGQTHLQAGRLHEALLDCDRAARLGGDQPRIVRLRGEAAAALEAHQRHRHRHRDLLDAARRNIDRGEISMGEALAARIAEPDSIAHNVLADADLLRKKAQAAITQAEQAMRRGSYEAAVSAVVAAQDAHRGNEQLPQVIEQLTQHIVEQTTKELEQGRIGRAESLLDQMVAMGSENREANELKQILQECRRTASHLQQNQMSQAHQALKRLTHLLPNAKWVTRAIEQVDQAASARDSLMGGPLGLLEFASTNRGVDRSVATADDRCREPLLPNGRSQPTADIPMPMRSSHRLLPNRLLLQIDGMPSTLVMLEPTITIGSISSSRRPDVGLLAPADIPIAQIERSDEDYFLRSDGNVRVNGRCTRRRLLSTGDKISLAPRCSMKYLHPNPASTSALIDLSGAKLARPDTRRILLLEHTMILGPGPTAHLRDDELDRPYVLHLRDGQLCYHAEADSATNAASRQNTTAITLGQTTRVGPHSITLNPWA